MKNYSSLLITATFTIMSLLGCAQTNTQQATYPSNVSSEESDPSTYPYVKESSLKGGIGDKVYVHVNYPLDIYREPTIESAVTAVVHAGDELTIINKNTEWTEVKTADGRQGWIANIRVSEDYEKIREWIEINEELIKKKNELPGEINIKRSIAEIEDKLKTIPASDYKTKFRYYTDLLNLDPTNKYYIEMVDYYWELKEKARKREWEEKKRVKKLKKEQEIAIKNAAQRKKEAAERQKEIAKAAEGYILKLNGWQWVKEYSYVRAKGSVKNISNKRIDYLKVIVSWFDKDNNLITYDFNYVEYTALMPGQTSPFSVSETYNPRMKKADINFILRNGQKPLWYNKE